MAIKDLKINRSLLTKKQQKIVDSSKRTPGWIYGLVRRKQDEVDRWRRPGTSFFVGQKQVFLPTFTITLLRTPGLPATTAQFIVPLNINKLDLRDYLWHAYNVRTFSIRSFIKLSPIQSVEPGSDRDLPGKKRHWRPRATKKMIVQLEKPFVWPQEPVEEEMDREFDRRRWERTTEVRERQMQGAENEKKIMQDRLSVAEQAQRLLEGKDKWKGVDVSTLKTPTTGRFNLPIR